MQHSSDSIFIAKLKIHLKSKSSLKEIIWNFRLIDF